MTTLRPSLRSIATACLFAVAAWPLVLFAVHAASPTGAVALVLHVEHWSARIGLGLLAAMTVGLLVYPPIPAGLRLLGSRLGTALRADRGPLLRAQGELRHIETGARQLEAGRLALQLGDLRAAVPHLVRAVELEQDHAGARYQLALLCRRLGRLAEARAHLEFVVARDPGHAFGEALLHLGRTCHELHDDAAAAALLRRHEREHGGGRRSHFWLYEALLAAGDRETARDALLQAATPPSPSQRLSAEEGWFRARARVAQWRLGGKA